MLRFILVDSAIESFACFSIPWRGSRQPINVDSSGTWCCIRLTTRLLETLASRYSISRKCMRIHSVDHRSDFRLSADVAATTAAWEPSSHGWNQEAWQTPLDDWGLVGACNASTATVVCVREIVGNRLPHSVPTPPYAACCFGSIFFFVANFLRFHILGSEFLVFRSILKHKLTY